MIYNWRFSFTFSNSDLQEYLNEIKSGTFTGSYMLRREVFLQARERKLISLPIGFIDGNAHMIPISEITFIEQPQQNYRH